MLDKGFENRREGIFVLSDKNPLAIFSDSVCVRKRLRPLRRAR